MKRKLFLLLTAVCLCMATAACATELEIVYPNVNFRSGPGGGVKSVFAGGEILTALDETWYDGQLWYHARSEALGDGYVAGEFARPIWQDERVFDPAHPTDADYVTDNVAAFYASLYRWLYTGGYCFWDDAEGCCQFRVKNGIGDAGVVQPAAQQELAELLLRHGLLVENEETAVLRSEAAEPAEKQQAASIVLKNHFGTDDIWQIIIHSGLLNDSEAHAPHGVLSNADRIRLRKAIEPVHAEARQR